MKKYPDTQKPLQEMPFGGDYGFLEAYQKYAKRCVNKVGPGPPHWPISYPQGMHTLRSTGGRINAIGAAGVGSSEDSAVFKCGRSTEYGFGKFSSERVVSTKSGIGDVWETPVRPCSSTSVFGTNGDSGSAIVDQDGKIIGIFSSGKPKLGIRHILPIQVIQWDLKERFGLTMSLYQPEEHGDVRGIEQPDLPEDFPTLDLPLEVKAGDNPQVLEMRIGEGEDLRFRVKRDDREEAFWTSANSLAVEWDEKIKSFLHDYEENAIVDRRAAVAVSAKVFGVRKPAWRSG